MAKAESVVPGAEAARQFPVESRRALPDRTSNHPQPRRDAKAPARAPVEFGREVCGSLEAAEQREWLVTNGIGGYASGTVAGSLTRRYHGLLVAALKPPLGRTLLVAKIEETVRCGEAAYPLSTNRWASGAIEPRGFQNMESFRLEGTTPVWRYALGDAVVEKRVWMRPGENTTYVRYALLRGAAAELELRALVNYRGFHGNTHAGDLRMNVQRTRNGVHVVANDGAMPLLLTSDVGACEPGHEWYQDFFLPAERDRGLDDREDHFHAATFRARLDPGRSVTIIVSAAARPLLDIARTTEERLAHERNLIETWSAANPEAAAKAPGWVKQLVLAADQFIVRRSPANEPEGRTVIAGYHWFGDWGRDTMVALPGLTLVTGRAAVARKILLTFANYADAGMLPNNFPDAGGKPEYNTVDAALLYFEALRQYFAATRDLELLKTLYPVLARMVEAHGKGTRYHIHADRSDGLLYAGEPGARLTWMDARAGGQAVTPRIGKPVEVNALWHNALLSMAQFARLLGRPASDYEKQAAFVSRNFQKFWNAAAGCCYDVIDSPGIGNDASVRPNQILAVSLPESPLTPEQQKAVVDICAKRLLTPYGLRSLAPDEPQYRGRYEGGPRERDGAYHQGTVWGWLIGPFVQAHLRVYGQPAEAAALLEPLGAHIAACGLGMLGEIFDGDAPFAPRGCIAQAWTVGEVLRAWHETASWK